LATCRFPSRSPASSLLQPVTDGSTVRVVIADDEPLVRRGLRTFIGAEPGLTIVGEARNGPDAVDLIRSARPDLVFLDVQMPELDGFGVLDALDGEPLPAVVFVTAYDEYAIRAFDVHAVDYLLKPFDDERFRVALRRVRSRLGMHRQQSLDERLEAVLAELRAREQYADRLLVKNEGRVTVVQVDDVDWIEAADNYVRVHTSRGRYLMREPIKVLERKLNPRQFARVHRSAIVNLARVRELQPLFGGEYAIILSTGAKLTLSRGYRDAFRDRLGSEL
jgi:two-component system, LytTR family, response regulator